MTAGPLPPDFFVFGSPRSGTTLVQRLMVELHDVAIPPETHFFSVYVPGRKWQFPLSAATLRQHLVAYADLDISPVGPGDVDPIMSLADGSVRHVFELFAALVRHAAGPAKTIGEKTPHHLLWWRHLAGAYPQARFIAVVRDPRAVVESNLRMPWGMDSVPALAEMWRSDQRIILAAKRQLGEKLLVVRYEDLVADADETQSALAFHIGHDQKKRSQTIEIGALATPREHWKEDALGPIRSDRVELWRDQLDRRDVSLVESTCAEELAVFGYQRGPHTPIRRKPHEAVQGVRVRFGRWRRVRAIDHLDRHHLGVRPGDVAQSAFIENRLPHE